MFVSAFVGSLYIITPDLVSVSIKAVEQLIILIVLMHVINFILIVC